MRPKDRALAERIDAGLLAYDAEERPLPGVHDEGRRSTLVGQLVSSVHRVEYVRLLTRSDLSDRRMEPSDPIFDPLRASVLQSRLGNSGEAFWLAFLSVHFGMHRKGGWRYLAEVYGKDGGASRWDWAATSADPAGFASWVRESAPRIRRADAPGGFGNHRKYESLAQTGSVVQGYVSWIGAERDPEALFRRAIIDAQGNRHQAFDALYRSMGASVRRFGRLGRFDFLTMVAKLGLADIEPGSAYLHEATGPRRGARLLFGDEHSARDMDGWLADLDRKIGVGMQVLEDALCNWQKSPEEFQAFRG